MASANNREVIHPIPDEDKSSVTVEKVKESDTDTSASDDGRPGKCNLDNRLSGDRAANIDKSFSGSKGSGDKSNVTGTKPGSRPELETTLFDSDSHCVYFDRRTYADGCFCI